MYQFLESIKIDKSDIYNINLHQIRMDNTILENFNIINKLRLSDIINIPKDKTDKLLKCRIIYERELITVEYIEYKRKNIKTLKLVSDNIIDYSFKYLDRKNIELLYNKKLECDDILIIKNGLITDSSFSNIIFNNGEKWETPNSPLLKGVQRDYLLENKIIIEKQISSDDLSNYKSFKLINSMNSINDAPELPISNIY